MLAQSNKHFYVCVFLVCYVLLFMLCFPCIFYLSFLFYFYLQRVPPHSLKVRRALLSWGLERLWSRHSIQIYYWCWKTMADIFLNLVWRFTVQWNFPRHCTNCVCKYVIGQVIMCIFILCNRPIFIVFHISATSLDGGILKAGSKWRTWRTQSEFRFVIFLTSLLIEWFLSLSLC